MRVPYKHQLKKNLFFKLISAAKKLVSSLRYLLIDVGNEHIIDVDDDACDDDDADSADADR